MIEHPPEPCVWSILREIYPPSSALSRSVAP
jgi:hypothetical protein